MTQGLKLLAAAALHPRLRSLLLFDASPEQLDSVQRVFASFLGAVEELESKEVWLAWHHGEEALWGLGHSLGPLWRRPGLLTQQDDQKAWRLIVSHDLTRLNLSAQRACVQILGADCVTSGRYGESQTWRPRLAWLAACPRDAVGRVSPHLLDRFALRWTNPSLGSDGPLTLRDWLDQAPKEGATPSAAVKEWTQKLIRARDFPPPSLGEAALERLTADLANRSLPGARPYLAVARLAVALAWLGGEAEASPERVDEAVALLGLEPPPEESAEPREVPETPRKDIPEPEKPEVGDPSAEGGGKGEHGKSTDRNEARDGQYLTEDEAGEPVDSSKASQESEIAGELDPWPENLVLADRDFASLQPPLARMGRRTEGVGVPVGVRPTSNLREMALLPTLFAAAPFQALRKSRSRRADDPRKWLLEERDFRAWRRTPAAHEMLVLVLDATAFGRLLPSPDEETPPRWRIDWPSSLVEPLRRAYIQRAAVALILLGNAGAANEYRAERLVARSVLVPAFQAALDCQPGRATPLADGLQLALETLRHALQHGRNTIRKARLVILSDGRGNVPLAVSRGEPLEMPVGRRGVEDALEVARELAGLRSVEAVVLDPQPQDAGHLVTELAVALEAATEKIPLGSPEELSA